MKCHDQIIIAQSNFFWSKKIVETYFQFKLFWQSSFPLVHIINLLSNAEWQLDVIYDKEMIWQIINRGRVGGWAGVKTNCSVQVQPTDFWCELFKLKMFEKFVPYSLSRSEATNPKLLMSLLQACIVST
jgi:hypothetical protein